MSIDVSTCNCMSNMYPPQPSKHRESQAEPQGEIIPHRGFFAKLAIAAGVACLLALALLLLAIVWLFMFGTPDAKTLPNIPLAQTSAIYDRTGTHVLYRMHGEENRKVLSHDHIPDTMRKATLAAEDSRFYEHHGIDVSSMARAVYVSLQAGHINQGASTITQQLARNAFFTRERTIKRKVLEIVMAFKIENTFSKDEILDMYLNRVPYGANAYGVEVASETYFGKHARELTLDEAATLSFLTKAPSVHSPYVAKEADTIRQRDYILSRMQQLGMITTKEMGDAMQVPTASKIVSRSNPIDAPHFVFYLIDQLEQQYGKQAMETGGWKIISTLDWDLQQKAEAAVRDGVARNKSLDASNAALTAIDPKTGEILAMVGSKDFFDTTIDGAVNVATRLRQPGSSFKPIAYAAAFEKGFQPETLLTDKYINFGPDGSGKDYTPQNYNKQYRGTLPMRNALSMSLNIPAVETLYLAGIPQTLDLAKRLGITSLKDVNRYGLALVLGGGEVKLLDMTSAYGVFANEGVRVETHGVASITEFATGKVIQEDHAEKKSIAIDAEVARKISSILSDNAARTPVFGSHSPLILPDRPVAAKTGTTQDFHDAWTIGYTPSIAVGVWTGNNDNHPLKEGSDGVYAAAPIWNDFMRQATQGKPIEEFTKYTTVESDKMLLTGKRTGEAIEYYDTKSGKKLSPEKASKRDPDRVRIAYRDPQHSILYYVNKNDPLGDTPPDLSDPMLSRWENGYIPEPENENNENSDESFGGESGESDIYINKSDYYGE